jgi:hypothetical protein
MRDWTRQGEHLVAYYLYKNAKKRWIGEASDSFGAGRVFEAVQPGGMGHSLPESRLRSLSRRRSCGMPAARKKGSGETLQVL